MNTLTVTVSGYPGTGMATLASMISEALKANGISVELNLLDDLSTVQMNADITILAEAVLYKEVKVVVNEMQFRRPVVENNETKH